jgi:alkanesulfonate monooxygenase SsuD/methylene tetrahydromethanopterin reductase-like flavin-dependent oxidoreductase (luciferase family)
MAVMGDKTCHWAGRFCDGVLLNALWGPAAVRHSAALVRQGAIDAGRDPRSVRIWTILVTASDVPEEVMLTTVVRRMNTYLLAREIIGRRCDANGWDRRDAARLIDELKKFDAGKQAGMHLDEHTTRDLDQLRHMRDLYPRRWLDEGVAVGTARECVRKMLDRFDAGTDGILFHGTHPAHLKSLLEIWPEHRPADRFHGRSVNPGL